MNTRTILVAAGLLAVPGLAWAQQGAATQAPMRGAMPMQERLRSMDLDANGTITKDEIRQVRSARFDSFDVNKDGVLDQSETGRRQAASALDKDNDGRITREEYLATAPRFMAFDRNRDGEISSQELAAMPMGMGPGGGRGMGQGMGGSAPPQGETLRGSDVMTIPPSGPTTTR